MPEVSKENLLDVLQNKLEKYGYVSHQAKHTELKQQQSSAKAVREKGKSLLVFPAEYIVIDTETTGLDPKSSELIEFAAVKIKGGQKIDDFQSLIKPKATVSHFITNLTGITNEMLTNAPLPQDIIPSIFDFIGADILVAHNAHFDINFLYDYSVKYLDKPFQNDFICTLRMSRKLFPDLENHKLKTICEALNIPNPPHRAMGDVLSTVSVFEHCRNKAEQSR